MVQISSHRGSSMGCDRWVPLGFRRRAPAVLRSHSQRHRVVLFLSIDEGWWAWQTLTVTCTVMSWLGHVLSMTRDALKSSWNCTGSVRSKRSSWFPHNWIRCWRYNNKPRRAWGCWGGWGLGLLGGMGRRYLSNPFIGEEGFEVSRVMFSSVSLFREGYRRWHGEGFRIWGGEAQNVMCIFNFVFEGVLGVGVGGFVLTSQCV